MKNFEEKACLCALNRVFGFEPKSALALISHLGCASTLFTLGEKELEELLGPYSRYRHHIRRNAVYEAAAELESLEKSGIQFIGWGEEGYPPLLAECQDPPIGLYIKSCTPASQLWTPDKSIAIVGTRDISPYGKDWCRKTVESLAATREKPLIVSGLALGTDICAHKAAVESGLPTIGVMATGPDSVYPYRHLAFADQICHTPGCALITDYPPGTPPLPVHFLRRNRIIAGMSDATILIESKLKGGGVMTARLAFSYDRDVYALPGRADDIRSQGCNYLIGNKIAEPIISTESLIRSIGMKYAGRSRKDNVSEELTSVFGGRIQADMIEEMAGILSVVQRCRGITVEAMCGETGMSYGRLSSLVSMLEAEGFLSIDLLRRCSICRRTE